MYCADYHTGVFCLDYSINLSHIEFILQSLPLISCSLLLTLTCIDITLVALDITLAVAWSPSSIYHCQCCPYLTRLSYRHRHYHSLFPPITMPLTSTSMPAVTWSPFLLPLLSLFWAFTYPITFIWSLSPLLITLKFKVPTTVSQKNCVQVTNVVNVYVIMSHTIALSS